MLARSPGEARARELTLGRSGSDIEFSCDAGSASAYRALPPSGRGRGVLVIDEAPAPAEFARGVCDRLARAGWTALAPELPSICAQALDFVIVNLESTAGTVDPGTNTISGLTSGDAGATITVDILIDNSATDNVAVLGLSINNWEDDGVVGFNDGSIVLYTAADISRERCVSILNYIRLKRCIYCISFVTNSSLPCDCRSLSVAL